MNCKTMFYTEIPIVISKMHDHTQIKSIVSGMLEKIPLDSMPFIDGEDCINRTDWLLEHDKKEYLGFVKPSRKASSRLSG
jgi:hypothetical protein